MSASGKFDLSSGSPDRPLYASGSGHRGCYGAASLQRLGSFCENMENLLLSSLSNMTRTNSSITHGDVLNYFQCLRFDPKSVVVDHKLNRPAVFERLASAVIGIPLEGTTLPASSKSKRLSSPSLEDLRRLKSGARESGTKARERVKIFNDCLSVINKCFPNIPLRKRSRLDALSNDQSNTLLSIDRSVSGMGIGKMGSQICASMSGLELEQPKLEERMKNAIPRKRTRTSMVDARMDLRANAPARLTGTEDKGRDVIRPSKSGTVQREDRTLSVAVDGWENSKMKKKRTCLKAHAAATSVTTKPVDGYRETKQGRQPGLATAGRPRLTGSHGFRSGIADGDVVVGKAEAMAQTSTRIHLSISRTGSDNSSLPHERRDRPSGRKKGRVNMKAVNKANFREDFSSGSSTSGSKLSATVQATRPGSVGGGSKLPQVVQRSISSNDWELSGCISKLPDSGAINHKHTTSTQSFSPHVANWVQRPQKISRTARRTNLLPIIPCNEDNSAADARPDMMVNERCYPGNSPQEFKMKSDNFSPAFSESEESAATEINSRDKNEKGNEWDQKSGEDVQKISSLLLPLRKSEAVGGEDHGHGVQRQGRTGRGFTSSRSLLPLMVENLGKVGATKQTKSSRPGLDKSERASRPPTRKLSDRKAYSRKKHIAINASADFLVGSDDAHEELLAAASAVTNTAQALSSPFWKKMERLFRFLSDADISLLKHQVNFGLALDTSAPALIDAESTSFMSNSYRINEFGREEIDTRSMELSPEHSAPGAKTLNEISLHQRVLAALIAEEGIQDLFCDGEEDMKYDFNASGFDMEKDMESDALFSRMSQDLLMPGTACSEYQYSCMSINDRVLMEVHSIGIYPDLVSRDEEINVDICRLDGKYQQQVSRKKGLLEKLLCHASKAKELQEKEFEGRALDKLMGMAYEKYMSCWGPNAHGMKSASGKMAKQSALAFVKWALERYQEFEATGKSCFNEPLYGEMFLSGVSHLRDGLHLACITDNESDKLHLSTSGCSVEVRTSAPVGTQQSQSSNNQEIYSSEVLTSANPGYEPSTRKEESWSNRVKRRELLLDDVGGTISTSPGVPGGPGGSLSYSAKGKRSEWDREGNENSREVLSRSGNTKIGWPASATVKGERKSKTKPKQKTAHLSASVDGPLEKMSDQPKVMLLTTLKSSEIDKNKNDHNLDMLEEPIDLSGLQLPEMDYLGAPNDLDGQGEDIGSWLNDVDGLQDHDFMGGLGIPIDDLADLDMMV